MTDRIITADAWSTLLGELSRLVHVRSPISPAQIDTVGRKLGFALPQQLRDLYLSLGNGGLGLLPLLTGREGQPTPRGVSPAEAMLAVLERNSSVLGWALAHSEPAGPDDDHIWPDGLLIIEDHGCAIYHAVDLKDPLLRVIQYECLEATDDPVEAAGGFALAYGEPDVPKHLQHRFVVASPSLLAWLDGLRREGERKP